MDIILTGASGFLGSHLLSMWLQQNPNGRAACIVRAVDADSARLKLVNALKIALDAQNAPAVLPDLLKRITVIPGNVESTEWAESSLFQNWLKSASSIEVFHGAASISFRKEDRDAIWQSNVEGLKTFMGCLATIQNIQTFNHISTAYVAGNRENWILEDDGIIPNEFNNHYEESKWTAESLVHHTCNKMGMAYRIFRPSIIIGNSLTFKTSADIGFYKVVDTLMQLTAHAGIGNQPLQIPFTENASLDLIPVDITVNEMLCIVKYGRASQNRTYHITNEHPLTVADIFFGISPLLGIEFCTEPPTAETSSLPLSLVKRSIRHYLPYFNNVRRFDRRNVHEFGANSLQDNFRLDIVKLRKFVKTYMIDKAANQPEKSDAETVDKAMQG